MLDSAPIDRWFRRYCRTGSPRALAAVFDRTAPELLRVARHLTKTADAAEDLVQETFLRAIESRQRYDPRRPVVPWLLGVLANLARRARTSLGPIGDSCPEDGPDSDPVATAQARELATELRLRVRALPEPYRSVLIDQLEHGASSRAIAGQRGCPASTVRNQVMRGMELLRRSLPAGFAGGLTATVTWAAPQLTSIRSAVLARAAAAQVGAPPALLGIQIMKSVIAKGVAVLAIGCATWFAIAVLPRSPAPASATPGAAPKADASSLQTSPDADGPRLVRERVATTPQTSTDATTTTGLGTLEVQVKFSHGARPAGDVGLYLRAVGVPTGLELRTDGDGVARFGDLEPATYLLQPDRCAGSRVRVTADTLSSVTLEIPLGVAVRGRVLDVAGAPVADATIYTKRREHHDWFQAAARSATDGEFEIADVAPGTELLARAEGYQPSHHQRSGRVAAAPGAEVDLVLRLGARGHRLRGDVVDARGAPVPHALVAIAADEDARQHPDGVLAQKYAEEFRRPMDLEGFLVRADDQGHFDSTEVPMGRALVVARAPDDQVAQVAAATVAIRPGADHHVRLQLDRGAVIEGTITRDDGLPYPDLPVLVEWHGSLGLGAFEHDVGHKVSDRVATTDGDGRFRVQGLLPGEHEIYVGAEVDARLRVDDRAAVFSEEVELEPQQVLRWTATIPRHVALAVRAVGPTDEPLPGYTVAIGSGQAPRAGRRYPCDAEGRCVIPRVAVESLAVYVFPPTAAGRAAAAFPVASIGLDEPPAEEVVVRVAQPEVAVLHGRVTGALDRSRHGPRLRLRATNGWWTLAIADARTGEFAFDGLPAGTYTIELRDPRLPRSLYGPFQVGTKDVAVGELAAPQPRFLTVRVDGPDGDLVKDATVWVATADGNGAPPRRCRVEAAVFRSPPLPSGPHVLFASAPGLAPRWARIAVSEDDTHARLRLESGRPQPFEWAAPRPGRERLTVDVALWMSVGTIRVEVLHDQIGATFDRATDMVRFELPLGPGHYELRATVNGARPAHASFVIGDGVRRPTQRLQPE
ncbi:MAG: sigma-70 family RNA polymerase sigma factor [Planctomycetota bacterium]